MPLHKPKQSISQSNKENIWKNWFNSDRKRRTNDKRKNIDRKIVFFKEILRPQTKIHYLIYSLITIILMVSVDNDEIIIHIFQYAWGIGSNKLKLIDWTPISILIENDPIIRPLPRQHRIQQRFLFEHLLKFKLFMRLLRPLQQDPHMLAEST